MLVIVIVVAIVSCNSLWIGLDWTGLDWTGLDYITLDSITIQEPSTTPCHAMPCSTVRGKRHFASLSLSLSRHVNRLLSEARRGELDVNYLLTYMLTYFAIIYE